MGTGKTTIGKWIKEQTAKGRQLPEIGGKTGTTNNCYVAWFSGYTPDRRIFYRETMLACGGRQWHNLEFEYPASDKARMDRFVDRASHALGAYRSAGC